MNELIPAILGLASPFVWALILVLVSGVKVVNQYERGVILTLGRFSGIKQPGWRFVWPIIQRMIRVDIRVRVGDVPNQEAITKDNISTKINAVIYYRVLDVDKAVLEVENFMVAMSNLAQTTMRNVVGEVELDGLLAERAAVSERIRGIIDKASDPWGVKVENVELKDIALPEEMKRVIAKQAEAEREKRAVITKAEGERIAADNLHKAAVILSQAPGALHLRTLATLNDISSDQSNTVIVGIPLEILRAFENKPKKS